MPVVSDRPDLYVPSLSPRIHHWGAPLSSFLSWPKGWGWFQTLRPCHKTIYYSFSYIENKQTKTKLRERWESLFKNSFILHNHSFKFQLISIWQGFSCLNIFFNNNSEVGRMVQLVKNKVSSLELLQWKEKKNYCNYLMTSTCTPLSSIFLDPHTKVSKMS